VCLVVVWFLGLITRSDSQADNGQAKEKAAAAAKEQAAKKAAADKAAEEKAAAAAKKAAADKAAEVANKADNAAAEPVHIGGATGSNAANINGIYDPTSELCCGRHVYKRRDADIWIELFEGKWQVKPASGKGKDNGWAFFAAGRALEECGGSTWQIFDGKVWARQASVKLVPESRAAFELVHRPMRQLFTCSYAHTPVCGDVLYVGISPDFHCICMGAYCRRSIRLSIDTQECSNWSGLNYHNWLSKNTFFSTSGRYYLEDFCYMYDCHTGSEVQGRFQEKEWTKSICGLSPDESIVFISCRTEHCAYLELDGKSVFTHPKPHKLQVYLMTGQLMWEFEDPRFSWPTSDHEESAIICLPDNDSFIVHHGSSLSKYSISSRSCISSADVSELLQGRRFKPCFFKQDSLKYSPDGKWISFENAVVNSRTLQVTILPSSGNMQTTPVFFLPGSKTAIFAKQVFSLVDGIWTLRMSPRPNALPLIDGSEARTERIGESEYYCYQGFNMVTRTSGSDIFFGNLSFAYARVQPDAKGCLSVVSVHLQDP
jgi:hypothetical protein